MLQLVRFASGADAELLAELTGDASGHKAEAWLKEAQPGGCDWVTVMERLPTIRAGLAGPAELLSLLPVQHARYYSASSAPLLQPGSLELTVGAHSFPGPGGSRKDGVCSSYLRRLTAGDFVELRVIRVPHFRLPLSNFAPVLVVASGTGIAPLRAFWQERILRARDALAAQSRGRAAATAAPVVGPFHLLFGARTRSELLYAAEVQAAVASGAITAAHYALSREPGVPKTYVQDLLRPGTPAATAVRDMLAHPKAAIFVCGGARMSMAVEDALKVLVGEAAWAGVKTAGRFHEDVFGLESA